MNKKMKVISKQRNSKMCIICGLDNKYGLKAPFYNMEDGSVMTKFQYSEEHQSYPGRVHGGLITAMLDEMGLRALWAYKEGNEEEFGVTMSLDTKYRKPDTARNKRNRPKFKTGATGEHDKNKNHNEYGTEK